MTMDASAITQIQKQLPQTEALKQYADTLAGKPIVLIPAGFDMKDVEEYMESPLHFKGDYRTNHIGSFVEYIGAHKSETTACFISSTHMRAVTVFNVGTEESPKHRHHKSTLSLDPTEAFESLNTALKDPAKNQQNFAYWLQDWADFIECKTENEETGEIVTVDLKDTLKAIRQIKVEEQKEATTTVKNFSAQQSTLESIGVTSAYPLPAHISFTCKPYKDLQPRTINMRMQVIRHNSTASLKLKAISMEQHLEEIREEFQALLQNRLKDSGINILIGSFDGNP